MKYLWNSLASLDVRPVADLFSSDIVSTPQHKVDYGCGYRDNPRGGGSCIAGRCLHTNRMLLNRESGASDRHGNGFRLLDRRAVAVVTSRPRFPAPARQPRDDCDGQQNRENTASSRKRHDQISSLRIPCVRLFVFFKASSSSFRAPLPASSSGSDCSRRCRRFGNPMTGTFSRVTLDKPCRRACASSSRRAAALPPKCSSGLAF